jgi:hypothetical protein
MCSSIIVLTLGNKVSVLGSMAVFIILELIAWSGLLEGLASLCKTEQDRRGMRIGGEGKAHYFESVSLLRWANENHVVRLYPACLTI